MVGNVKGRKFKVNEAHASPLKLLMQQRYEALELRAALSRRIDYEQACKELTLILQRVYASAPKKLQILVFEDVLYAVHRLSELETSLHLLAVTKLVQAAENVLPRQRKIQVGSEFKHAAVTHRRHNKAVESESCGFGDLAKDILIVIFGHLDARSLAGAATVCRFWNTAASDELIWKKLFNVSFKNFISEKRLGIDQGLQADRNQPISWRVRFKETASRNPSWFYASNRAFCMSCARPIWLEDRLKCMPFCCFCGSGHRKLKPLAPIQVAQFLLEELTSGSSSSSDSDSDTLLSEDSRTKYSKLWSIPKLDFQKMT
ncbi:hypothetical protein GOP47_0015472 [Adiantum capillus-veneris]|uniref:F-box domain-containing protein n=1 Tax=Adiantum capillus-veneris TaxID=13818 RepID=A0A9D4UJS3_ADICA|nr:hypothetical protein GOP47_0015472 [Adiantum capillus-veneris]